MSTSILYHGFGIRGYSFVSHKVHDGATIFTVKDKGNGVRCSACNSKNVILRGYSRRRYRTLPIGSWSTYVDLDVPRLGCKDCGAVRQAKVQFAESRCSYTRSFERYVLELSQAITIQDGVRLVLSPVRCVFWAATGIRDDAWAGRRLRGRRLLVALCQDWRL